RGVARRHAFNVCSLVCLAFWIIGVVVKVRPGWGRDPRGLFGCPVGGGGAQLPIPCLVCVVCGLCVEIGFPPVAFLFAWSPCFASTWIAGILPVDPVMQAIAHIPQDRCSRNGIPLPIGHFGI